MKLIVFVVVQLVNVPENMCRNTLFLHMLAIMQRPLPLAPRGVSLPRSSACPESGQADSVSGTWGWAGEEEGWGQ